MKNNFSGGLLTSFILVAITVSLSGCLSYSFSGVSTSAKTVQVDQFFNNTDLGPANLSQTFTNKLKDYYQRNSSLKVVAQGGEIQLDGTLTTYSVTNIAPVASAGDGATTQSVAALSRLTIAVKANYIDNIVPANSFKDKTFSFYADFPNEKNLSDVQEDLEKKIFEQIMLDIFNATIANW